MVGGDNGVGRAEVDTNLQNNRHALSSPEGTGAGAHGWVHRRTMVGLGGGRCCCAQMLTNTPHTPAIRAIVPALSIGLSYRLPTPAGAQPELGARGRPPVCVADHCIPTTTAGLLQAIQQAALFRLFRLLIERSDMRRLSVHRMGQTSLRCGCRSEIRLYRQLYAVCILLDLILLN